VVSIPGLSIARCATAAPRSSRLLARPGVHHLDLVVSSLERSLMFYRELLGPLGYTDASEIVGERGERVVYLGGRDAHVNVSLREAQSPSGPYDRYAVGLHHVAFEASSRELVDDRLAWAKEKGLEIENEPQEWPYIPGYYAGFFHDPDGIKLEIVFVP
jgi:glyoxylase I family protein